MLGLVSSYLRTNTPLPAANLPGSGHNCEDCQPGASTSQVATPAAEITISPEAQALLAADQQQAERSNAIATAVNETIAADSENTANPEAASPPVVGPAAPAEADNSPSSLNQNGEPTDPASKAEDERQKSSDPSELSSAEEQQVQELQNRDREVRAHEMAHKSAAGQYAAGGPFYEYQRGPDNQQYAVGGHVNIETGKEKTPEETLQKAQVIRRAASGPCRAK